MAAVGLGRAISAAAARLRTELAGAGVPASLDPGSLNPPGAWVRARTVTPETLTAYRVRFDVFLIVGDANALQAMDGLGDMLTVALSVIEPDEPINYATSVVLPHGPQPLPAVQLVVDQLVDPTMEA